MVKRMQTQLDFTFYKGKGQEADDTLRVGVTQVTGQLFLGGQEDVTEALPHIQVWVDLRSEGMWNRVVEIPSHVTYIRIPIVDGDSNRASQVFKKAKQIVQSSIEEGEKVLVSCHAGISRSVVLVWWVFANQLQDAEKAWSILKLKRPIIEPDERFFPFIKEHIMSIKASDR
jgi:protein-tyrosine phosphatase